MSLENRTSSLETSSLKIDQSTNEILNGKVEQFTQRLKFLHILIYLIILIVNIMILVAAYYGYHSNWFQQLKKPEIPPAIIIAAWVFAIVLSYAAIFVLWKNVCPGEVANDSQISIAFMITSLLNLLWVVLFFQAHNLTAAITILFVNLLLQMVLTVYIWHKKRKAAGFMIPLVLLMIYLLYYLINIATTNNIKV